jgi:hypothetical protein
MLSLCQSSQGPAGESTRQIGAACSGMNGNGRTSSHSAQFLGISPAHCSPPDLSQDVSARCDTTRSEAVHPCPAGPQTGVFGV